MSHPKLPKKRQISPIYIQSDCGTAAIIIKPINNVKAKNVLHRHKCDVTKTVHKNYTVSKYKLQLTPSKHVIERIMFFPLSLLIFIKKKRPPYWIIFLKLYFFFVYVPLSSAQQHPIFFDNLLPTRLENGHHWFSRYTFPHWLMFANFEV